MNQVFKVIWNQATQSWVAVSELSKAHGKTKSVKVAAVAAAVSAVLGSGAALAATNVDSLTSVPTTATNTITNSGDYVVVGQSNTVTDSTNAVVLGHTNKVQTAVNAVALGQDLKVSALNTTVTGINLVAETPHSIVIGQGSEVRTWRHNATTAGTTKAMAATAEHNIAIGNQTYAYGNNIVAINANTVHGGDHIVIGKSTVVGNGSDFSTNDTIAGQQGHVVIGNNIVAQSGMGSVMIGDSSYAGPDPVSNGVYTEVFGTSIGTKSQGINYGTGVGYRARGDSFATQVTDWRQGATAVGTYSTIVNVNGATSLGTNSVVAAQDGTAVGNSAGAIVGARQGTAVGYNATSRSWGSVAIGNQSTAGSFAGAGVVSFSYGDTSNRTRLAQANSNASVAVGNATQALSNNTVAIGNQARAGGTITADLALLNTLKTNIETNIATQTQTVKDLRAAYLANPNIETLTTANDADYKLAEYQRHLALLNKDIANLAADGTVAPANAIAIGNASLANHLNATAIGADAQATGNASIAIGTSSRASGNRSTAVGFGNIVSGNFSGAFGDPNTVSGDRSYAYGNDNTITGNGTFVVGSNVTAATDDSVILGADSKTAGSHAIENVSTATVNGITYGDFFGKVAAAGNFVSVGAVGDERKIINVAAGNISASSTEAINGSQLYIVTNNITTTNTVTPNADGSVTAGTDKAGTPNLVNATTVASAINGAGWNVFTKQDDATAAKVGDGLVNPSNNVTLTGLGSVKVAAGTSNATDYVVNISVETANISANTATGKVGSGTDGSTTVPSTTALATAGDVINAVNGSFWNVQASGAAVNDGKVNPGNTLNFIGKNGVTVAANGTSTTDAYIIDVSANVDGTTIKVNDAGQLTAVQTADTNTVTSLANGTTTTVKNTGTTDAPVYTVEVNQADVTTAKTDTAAANAVTVNNAGKAVAPTTNADSTFLSAQDVVNLVNSVGFNVTSDVDGGAFATTGHTKANSPVTAGSQVTFKAGDNLVIKQDGTNFTYATASNVSFTSVNANGSITVQPTIAGYDAITIANNTITGLNAALPTASQFKTVVDGNGATATSQSIDPTSINVTQAATLGDVLNAGWNLQNNGAAKDFVTPYNTVNFVNGTGTVANVVTTNGEVSNVTFNVNVDGTTIKVGTDGKLYAVNTGGNGTPTVLNNGTTTTVTNTGTADAPVYTVEVNKAGFSTAGTAQSDAVTVDATGKAVAPTANADSTFLTADAAVNLVNAVSHNVTIGSDKTEFADQAGKADASVGAGDTLTFVAGKNLVAKQNGTTITFATDNNVTFNTVNATAGVNSSKVVVGDISPNGTVTGTPVTIANNAISGLTNNLPAATTSQATPTNVDTTKAATVGDVLNAGFNLQNNGEAKDVVTPYNTVNFINGNGSTAVVTTKDGVSDVTFNVNTVSVNETETDTPAENAVTVNTDGKAVAATNATTNFLTANDTVTLVNNTAWNVQSKAVGTGKVTNVTPAATKVKAGNTVNINAGNNIEITRDGRDVTVATSMNPNFTTVTATDSIGIVNGPSLSTTGIDAAGKRVTNVARGVAPTDAVNVSQLKDEIGKQNKLRKAGTASSLAAAGLMQAYREGQSAFTAGVGQHQGQTAIAVGYSRISDSGKVGVKFSVGANTQKELSGAASVGYFW